MHVNSPGSLVLLLAWVSACGSSAALPSSWGAVTMDSSGGTETVMDCDEYTYGNVFTRSTLAITDRHRDGFTLRIDVPHNLHEMWTTYDCMVTDRRNTSIDFECPGNLRHESLGHHPSSRLVMARATGTFVSRSGVVMDHAIELLENNCAEDDETCRDFRPEGCILSWTTAHGNASLPE